ncbi:DUF2231 domain-containing protein [Paenisporosarcina cavernae]|uniref:DUF2231 domain-containing protein n=1 Tax=Paenisporosarcina cavernae TaxID=2320858 RepID=A0A385YT87_9BACL|nr:DUF2231 domain-containing protein [Paenisporosarcina cavernae]AYC28792.1 hypothetical protein D3873_02485 [Paenisporosarcina cavernae]
MPLHPLIVHFPIALLLLATVIELLALWKRSTFNTTGTVLLVVGFLSGIVSYMTGDGAEEFAEEKWGRDVFSLIHTHETLAAISLVLFGGAAGLKLLSYFFPKYQKAIYIIVVVLAVIGSITLAITGHYGGRIVYES